MNKSDYDKYYKKGGTYVIPVEIFNDLCEELEEQERHIKEADFEIERLNNIINELEKWLKGGGIIDFDIEHQVLAIKDILNKLQELKGSDKE